MSAFDPYSVYSRPSVRTRKGQILRQKPTVFRSAFSTDEIARSKEVLEAYGYYVSKEQPSPPTPPTPPTPPEPEPQNYWDSVHGLYYFDGEYQQQLTVNLGTILGQLSDRELWVTKCLEYDHAQLKVIVNNAYAYLSANDTKGNNLISYTIFDKSYNNLAIPLTTSGKSQVNCALTCSFQGQGKATHYANTYHSTSYTTSIDNGASPNGYLTDYQLDDEDVYDALNDLPSTLPNIGVYIDDDTLQLYSFSVSVEILIAFYN